MQLQLAAKPSVLCCHLANKKEKLCGLSSILVVKLVVQHIVQQIRNESYAVSAVWAGLYVRTVRIAVVVAAESFKVAARRTAERLVECEKPRRLIIPAYGQVRVTQVEPITHQLNLCTCTVPISQLVSHCFCFSRLKHARTPSKGKYLYHRKYSTFVSSLDILTNGGINIYLVIYLVRPCDNM